MNYNNPNLLNVLAGQYVLGSLKGSARKRFQRLMLSNQKAREATLMWEQNLNNLANAIAPQAPSEKVWLRIIQKIEHQSKPSKTVIRTKPSIWRVWSLVATAAAIVFAFIVMQPTNPIKDVQQIALVQNKAQQSLWFININKQVFYVKASSELVAKTDRDYQLWMILKDQDTPISLGLLPKQGHKTLVKNIHFTTSDITLLAVSLEPIGGSPSGLPSQVLHTTELVVL
jgi:anti-sigma-K factor RskA